MALYDQLARLDPSPIVTLSRAVAVAELDGPEVALAAGDRLADPLTGNTAETAYLARRRGQLGCPRIGSFTRQSSTVSRSRVLTA